MADEHSLNFFHGAILDEDADVFLVQDGDYLIQAKPDGRFGPPKLILAVKKGQTKVRRIDIVKIEGAGYRFMGKSYADLQQLINKFSTHPLEFANGDTILLKRPIPKSKFSFNHKDIRLQQKIYSDTYGTVYKGVMVKDDHPIIVKRIDSDGKDDQALIDMMKEAREMCNDPNFYGLIFDRLPYLLVMLDISATKSTNICRESFSSAENNIVKEPEIAAVNNGTIPTKKLSTNSFLPEEIKSEFLTMMGTSEANIAQNESLMKWLSEKVFEMVESKIGKIDKVVREKVAKEKLEIETRFRVQIQEMKDEINAAQKKQEEAQARCEQLQEQLTQKIKDLKEAQRLAVCQTASVESDSNICSSIYSQSTSNDELTNDSEFSPNNHKVPYFSNTSSSIVDQEISSSSAQNTSNERDQTSAKVSPPLIFNHLIDDWRRSMTSEECLGEYSQCESLSSIGSSSSDSEDDEEINVELSPRYYNDTNDLLNEEEVIDINVETILLQNCRAVKYSFTLYWECVRKLFEDRQKIIRILKKRLEPEQSLRFKDEEEVIRVNAKIQQCENLLNSYIPVVPRWKATYQKDTGKKIIIRKGFIYERIGETNKFQCIFDKETILRCRSFIKINNSDTLIEGSFCFHNHPAADNEEYADDLPPPGTPISFQRVTKNGQKYGKYEKLLKFLKVTVNELSDWQHHAIICDMKLELLRKYLHDVEAAEQPNNKTGFICKMVIAETKNLLNCIRLDKQ